MPDQNNSKDKLAFFSETPDIGELRSELQRSLYNGGNVARLNSNDDIRLARWDGQSDDGKKYSNNLREGEQAFPFEGASDVRCRLVDQTINELVVLLVSSWQLARLRVSGTEVGDASRAASIQTLADWVVNNKMRADLLNEAELLGQYTQQFGWSVAHIGWERRLGIRPVSITLADLEQRAMGGDIIANEAVTSLKGTGTSDYSVSAIMTLLGVGKDDAARVCDELMISGTSTFNQEYAVSNAPVVAALKPFDEICFPPETLDLQDARVIFRRTFMTEVELREMVKTAEWDEAFVNEAVQTTGMSDWYSEPNLIPATTNIGNTLERADNLIEIVYAYNRQIGPNGVPCIYYTVFCPNARDDLFAKHEMLDYAHGFYPFVEYRRERLRAPSLSAVACLNWPTPTSWKSRRSAMPSVTARLLRPCLPSRSRSASVLRM